MFFAATGHLREGLVRVLQLAFSTNSEFQWSPDKDSTQITISSSFPTRAVKYPLIVVTTANGPVQMRTIGQEYLRQETTEVSINGSSYNQVTAEVFGGGFSIRVDVDVAAELPTQRDRILDLTLMYLRWVLWDKLRAEAINITNITAGGDRTVFVGIDPINFRTLTLDTFSEWEEKISIAAGSTVDGICITNVFAYQPDGATELFYP